MKYLLQSSTRGGVSIGTALCCKPHALTGPHTRYPLAEVEVKVGPLGALKRGGLGGGGVQGEEEGEEREEEVGGTSYAISRGHFLRDQTHLGWR